jgi:hypothetical protein
VYWEYGCPRFVLVHLFAVPFLGEGCFRESSLRRDGLSPTGDVGSIVTLELAIIKEQRARLIELRDKAEISDDVLRRFQSILDLKESQLDQSRSSWEM